MKVDPGPMFPSIVTDDTTQHHIGASQRATAAMLAMHALIGNASIFTGSDPNLIAERAVTYADALMERLEK